MRKAMKSITATELRKNLSKTFLSVNKKKERFRLKQRHQDIAALVPLEDLELLEKIEDILDYKEAVEALEEYEKTGNGMDMAVYLKQRGIK